MRTNEKREFSKLENALICVEHDVYGVWYFTNISKVCAAIGCSTQVYYYHIDKCTNWKGWIFRTVQDCGDIPFKWINPTNWEIIKNSEK